MADDLVEESPTRFNLAVSESLARIMHKFSTVAPKPSALTALHSRGLLDVPYSTPAVPSVARLVRTAFSTPRYKNLCIIRASMPVPSAAVLCWYDDI